MQERHGQLAKGIVGRALPAFGILYLEHEIPLVDAQAGDAYFIPEPGKEAERALLGWLDNMTRETCLLEMIQSTPGPRVVRGNVRKQLTLDHGLFLEAAKQKCREPPLPRLWMLSAGRPDEVLEGYNFRRMEGWPPGFWERSRLDSVGIVVLSELPRQRDTLLLRLLGRGKVFEDAIADLKALPEDAIERGIAYPPLIALRVEAIQDRKPQDEEARTVFMELQEIYDQWMQRTKADAEAEGLAKGLARGLTATLTSIHERRFGTLSEELRDALATIVTLETIGPWSALFMTASSADEVAAAIRRGAPAV